jgi:hypothetical protein|tara:strand:+ start:1305 stop:1562 length:258 start_codon:yes stop_codon:yes gene_type:complete
MKSEDSSAAGTSNSPLKKLPRQNRRRKTKPVAADEHPSVVRIPDVVGVTIVAVEPELVLVTLDVEHVEVAVRVRFMRSAVRATAR